MLYQPTGGLSTYYPQVVEWQSRTGNQYKGRSRSEVPNSEYFGLFNNTGSLSADSIFTTFSQETFSNLPSNWSFCDGYSKLKYSADSNCLKGTWFPLGISNCPVSTVELWRLELLSSTTFCSGDSIKVTVSGRDVRWYSDSMRKIQIGSGNVLTASFTTSTTVYATQTFYNTESLPAVIPITIRSKSRIMIEKTICFGQSYMGYSQAGTYTISDFPPGQCERITTLTLKVIEPVDTTMWKTVCYNETFAGYHTSGVYKDTFRTKNGCDSIRRIIHLTVLPLLQGRETKQICKGTVYRSFSNSGDYVYTLKSAYGCDSTISLDLQVIDKPQPYFNQDSVLCLGKTVELSPIGNFKSYLWQDGSRTRKFLAQSGGVYTVEVTNNICPEKERASIIIKEKDCDIYVPTAFTPNGDRLNDKLHVLNSTYNVKQFRFVIFNRLGQKVFETTDPSSDWDGTYKGQLQASAAFIWYLSYTKTGHRFEQSGTVTLLR